MKKKFKNGLKFWGVLIIGGIALIIIADALAEELRSVIGQSAMLWISAGIILLMLLIGFGKKIWKLTLGQLGK